MKEFLTGNPIKLNQEEMEDIQKRKEMDERRIEEQRRFYEIARERARELDVYMERFRRDVVERSVYQKDDDDDEFYSGLTTGRWSYQALQRNQGKADDRRSQSGISKICGMVANRVGRAFDSRGHKIELTPAQSRGNNIPPLPSRRQLP